MELYSGLSTEQKCDMFLEAINRPYADPRKVDLKINYNGILCHMHHECYRENQVSYFPMLPLLEKPQVRMSSADYIIYMHPYARCEDVSQMLSKRFGNWLKCVSQGQKL